MQLPETINSFIQELFYTRRKPAFLCISHDGLVAGGGGNLEHYGISEIPVGSLATRRLLFLEGLLPLDSAYLLLSFVLMESGPVTDIHVFAVNSQHWILFLDATQEEAQRRRLQQTSYDLKLLQKKQLHLLEQLELANTELENRVAQRTIELVQANELLRQEILVRRQAEDEVRRQRDLAQLYLDVAGVMLLVVGKDENVILVNRRGAQILGCDESVVIGENWFDRFVPERIRAQQREILANILQRKPLSDAPYEGVVLTAEGTERIITWRHTVLTDDLGESFGTLSSGEDITVRRQTEEALRKSQEQLIHAQKMEAVGKLASGVAHDFNNLMTVVGGYSELLLQTMSQEAEGYDDIAEIKKAGDRAAVLTRQLLAFSSKQTMQPKVLNMNSVIEDMLKMLRRLLTPSISITTELEPDLLAVKADPGHLEQVLMNLVVNARDAMPDGGVITIRTTNAKNPKLGDQPAAPSGNCACLSVIDTGTGMEKAILDRVFEPFFTTKPAGKGTGLGLSVVYGIVKQHSGNLRVASEPGRGTQFDVFLPAYKELHERVEIENLQVKDLQGAGEHVLIVDYEPRVRAFTSRILQENGYIVVEAETAAQALEQFMLQKGLVEVLLTEVMLPDRSGLLLSEQLISFKPDLRVVIMAGAIDQDLQHLVVEVKRFALLPKPYTPLKLLYQLQVAIENPL